MLLERFKSSRERFLITATIGIGVLVLVIGGVIVPLFFLTHKASQELKEAMLQRATGEERFRASREVDQEVTHVQNDLDGLRASFVIEDRELTKILGDIENLAGAYHIVLRTDPAFSGEAATGLTLGVEGSFGDIMNFMRRLEQLPKFSAIDGFNLAVQGSAVQDVATRLFGTISFKLYLPPKEEAVSSEIVSQEE